MDDVETAVRRSLTQRAAGAPDDGALLSRVRAQARRRRRRDTTGLVAAAVVGVLTFAILAVQVSGGTGEQPAPPLAPPVVPDNHVRFGAGDVYSKPFPYTPGAPFGGLTNPYVTMVAGDPALDYSAGTHDITVRVRKQPSRPVSGDVVAVRRTIGNAWVEGSHRIITWQEPDGWWLEIRAPVEYQIQAIAKYADSLTEVPVPMSQPYTFTLVPLGLIVDNIGPAAVTFRPPRLAPDEGYAGKITVMLARDEEASADGQLYSVGGAKVRVVASPTGGTVAWLDLDGAGAVAVQVAESLVVNADELAAFAAGIRPTGIARAANG
jgi:hypothetical protein